MSLVVADDCKRLLSCSELPSAFNWSRFNSSVLVITTAGLTDYAWQLAPKLVITRGAMETPERYTPGVAPKGPWEGNLTMGTEWPWRPTNEQYKSGTQLIETLIDTRAKGGNLLLNIGPRPDGEIPIEQESLLREIALWNFVNGEAIKNVRPWVVTNENNIWFAKNANENVVYAFLTQMGAWPFGEAKTVTLHSVKATAATRVSVLGQSDEIVEYHPETTPKTTWKQDESGLHITAYRAQRLYTNRTWPDPIVLKIVNAGPEAPKAAAGRGSTPPTVESAPLSLLFAGAAVYIPEPPVLSRRTFRHR